MRFLTVIRHAKAEDAAAWREDFQRPLTERGLRDARTAARFVAGLQPPIDWWLTSPAVRALQTAAVLHPEAGGSAKDRGAALQQEPAIYMAQPETLLELLRRTPPAQEHVAIVGHNPGLEALVAGLCTGGSPGLNFRMPTAAIAHLELEVAHWEQMRWGCGELRLLLTPKALKK
jgi:phosphohistidine phosphatase